MHSRKKTLTDPKVLNDEIETVLGGVGEGQGKNGGPDVVEVRVEGHLGNLAIFGADHGEDQQQQVHMAGLEQVHEVVAKDLVVDGKGVRSTEQSQHSLVHDVSSQHVDADAI